MGYKISESFVRKISTPVVCRINDKEKEYKNGASFSETALDKPYEVDSIEAVDGKVVIVLKEKYSAAESDVLINWIGEEAVISTRFQSPRCDNEDEWVKSYKRDFGEEPSFF